MNTTSTTIIMLATVTIGLIAATIQTYGKWLELQTARIKRAEAQSETAKTETPRETRRKGVFWYVWNRDKLGFGSVLLLVCIPLVWGIVSPQVTALFIWIVAYISPMAYVMGYLVLEEASEARTQDLRPH